MGVVGGLINYSANGALHPVDGIIIVLRAVIVGDGTGEAASVAGGVAGVVKVVRCAGIFINSTAESAFHPVCVVIQVLNRIAVGDGANISALVASGVAGVVITVQLFNGRRRASIHNARSPMI